MDAVIVVKAGPPAEGPEGGRGREGPVFADFAVWKRPGQDRGPLSIPSTSFAPRSDHGAVRSGRAAKTARVRGMVGCGSPPNSQSLNASAGPRMQALRRSMDTFLPVA